MADGNLQRVLVVAFGNDSRESYARNFETPDRSREFCGTHTNTGRVIRFGLLDGRNSSFQ